MKKAALVTSIVVVIAVSVIGIKSAVGFLNDSYKYTSSGLIYIQYFEDIPDEVSIDEHIYNVFYEEAMSIVFEEKVLEDVISELGLDITADELKEKINVAHIEETAIVRISVGDNNADQSSAICNCVMKFAVGAISDELGVDVRIIDEAETPAEQNHLITKGAFAAPFAIKIKYQPNLFKLLPTIYV